MDILSPLSQGLLLLVSALIIAVFTSMLYLPIWRQQIKSITTSPKPAVAISALSFPLMLAASCFGLFITLFSALPVAKKSKIGLFSLIGIAVVWVIWFLSARKMKHSDAWPPAISAVFLQQPLCFFPPMLLSALCLYFNKSLLKVKMRLGLPSSSTLSGYQRTEIVLVLFALYLFASYFTSSIGEALEEQKNFSSTNDRTQDPWLIALSCISFSCICCIISLIVAPIFSEILY